MRGFLLIVILLTLGIVKGLEWFRSPRYLDYILQNKEKQWASDVLLKTAQYHIFSGDMNKATLFLDVCLGEDFKDRYERPDCMYERARVYDETFRNADAIHLYFTFAKDFPNHPKAKLAQRRAYVLRDAPN